MEECPLVRLAKHRKILKKFEQIGMVAIPVSEWMFFFETLAYMHRDGDQQGIYCEILDGYLVFSKTRCKPTSKPGK